MNKNDEPERFKSSAYLNVIDGTQSAQIANLTREGADLIRRVAQEGYPNEVCGLLVGQTCENGWQITDVREVNNLNEDRAADRFQLDPAGYQAVDREFSASNKEVIGVWHSHPDCPAKPSPTDLDGAWEGFAYVIVNVCDSHAVDIRCWALNEAANQFQEVMVVIKHA
ncbi:MAG: M67 family metallopeptidase [Mariprofundaceae bacterium]